MANMVHFLMSDSTISVSFIFISVVDVLLTTRFSVLASPPWLVLKEELLYLAPAFAALSVVWSNHALIC